MIPIEILSEVTKQARSILTINYNSYCITPEEALRAMEEHALQELRKAFEAARERIYSEADREVMAKYRTIEDYEKTLSNDTH